MSLELLIVLALLIGIQTGLLLAMLCYWYADWQPRCLCYAEPSFSETNHSQDQ